MTQSDTPVTNGNSYLWMRPGRGYVLHLIAEFQQHSANPKALCRRRVREPQLGEKGNYCPDCIERSEL